MTGVSSTSWRCMVEDGTADAICRMSEEELDMSDIT